MHTKPIINSLQATLREQARFAGNDDAMDAAVSHLVESIEPALRVAALELAEQAASEVRAQRPDLTVDVVMVEGDPTLRLSDAEPDRSAGESVPDEDFAARISLRLPPTLKATIEDAAGTAGESLNTWIVDAVGQQANRNRKRQRRTRRVNQSFDL